MRWLSGNDVLVSKPYLILKSSSGEGFFGRTTFFFQNVYINWIWFVFTCVFMNFIRCTRCSLEINHSSPKYQMFAFLFWAFTFCHVRETFLLFANVSPILFCRISFPWVNTESLLFFSVVNIKLSFVTWVEYKFIFSPINTPSDSTILLINKYTQSIFKLIEIKS